MALLSIWSQIERVIAIESFWQELVCSLPLSRIHVQCLAVYHDTVSLFHLVFAYGCVFLEVLCRCYEDRRLQSKCFLHDVVEVLEVSHERGRTVLFEGVDRISSFVQTILSLHSLF